MVFPKWTAESNYWKSVPDSSFFPTFFHRKWRYEHDVSCSELAGAWDDVQHRGMPL